MEEGDYQDQDFGLEPENTNEGLGDIIGDVLFGEMDDEEREQFFLKIEQDRTNDSLDEWRAMYGFDHECSCATDIDEGKTVTISECYAGACDNAFDALRKTRAFLYAIATSPTKESSVLKALAAEAFAGEG